MEEGGDRGNGGRGDRGNGGRGTEVMEEGGEDRGNGDDISHITCPVWASHGGYLVRQREKEDLERGLKRVGACEEVEQVGSCEEVEQVEACVEVEQ